MQCSEYAVIGVIRVIRVIKTERRYSPNRWDNILKKEFGLDWDILLDNSFTAQCSHFTLHKDSSTGLPSLSAQFIRVYEFTYSL